MKRNNGCIPIIAANENEIISNMIQNSKGKEYFIGLSMPPAYIIELVTRDLLQCFIIYAETGGSELFYNKITWLKSILDARLSHRDIKLDLHDLMKELEKVLLQHCSDCIKEVSPFFKYMMEIVEEIF